METRRSFMGKAALAGIAGILASGKAPVFAQTLNTMRIGQVGLGSHSFLLGLINPPKDTLRKVKIVCTGVWDDYPGVAETMGKRSYGKPYSDLERLIKDSDGIHIEHGDFRRVLEFARPALEAGKPVFINRPFTATIADAEEAVRLAKTHDAPLMSASTAEFQPEITEIQKFAQEKGPVRAYEAYLPEQIFSWMFPHVINSSHAAFGGGIESAYFTGTYNQDMGKWVDEKRPLGASLCVLTWKSRNGQPPMIGMNQIGDYPALQIHFNVFAAGENRMFTAGQNRYSFMHKAIYELYAERKIPRPYEALLEEHRALVATNVSRLTGRAVNLDSLGGDDTVPYSEEIRRWLVRKCLGTKS
ncbi:MAG: Gfo/Idh/MocA family oxidoreductase [Candidatus Latescibacterota bacterium]